MRPAFDPAGHRVPRTKPTCLLHTGTPRRRRPFALVLRLHQHQSSRNLHLQYLAKNQSIQRCQSLITPGSDHPPVLEPHMVLNRYRDPPRPVGLGRPTHLAPRAGSVPFSVYPLYFAFVAHEKKLVRYNFTRNSKKIKEKLFTKIHTLFYVLG
jgi:hypothetical protein